MDIQLKNADFSDNSVGRTIAGVVYKDTTDNAQVSLGNLFANGNKVKYRVVIDDLGTMPLGTQVTFLFGVSDNGSSIADFQLPNPAFTTNVALGEVYSGEFNINNLSAANPYTLFFLNHEDFVQRVTMLWHIDYECFVEN